MSKNHFLHVFVAAVLGAGLSSSAWGQADFEWTFGNNGLIDYTLTSVSSTELYAGSLPANDPTINLQVGMRYRVTVVNFNPHPLEIIAKGATAGSDVVLLAQGSASGSFESDVDVNWTDDGAGHVEFTLTQPLVDAMNASGLNPGYRCGIHTTSMRGDFNIEVGSTPIADPIPEPVAKGSVAVGFETVMAGLTAPLGLVAPDDGTDRLFIYDQAGQVWIVENGSPVSTPFLDVSDRLTTLGIGGPGSFDERGLIGFALHPDFASNPRVYTYTSEPDNGAPDFTTSPPLPGAPDHQSVIAEWMVDAGNPNAVDLASRRELMRIDQPQFNHDGGTLRFGPDGYLYIALGDGGAADDQGDGHGDAGNGQRNDTIYGSILRIDVDGTNSANGQYGIPAGNPFVGSGAVEEIYAYGFRNPFMFSFDRTTGELYVADVGQNDIEEVDLVTTGGNYGWRHKEGSFFFDPNGTDDGFVTSTPVGTVPPGLIDPIAEYDHDEGIAIVGGYVYRGSQLTGLGGRYITGDFSRGFAAPEGRLFYLLNGTFLELQISSWDRPLGMWLKGFGQDGDGEVYAGLSTEIGPFGTTGKMVKLVPSPPVASTQNQFVCLIEGSQSGTTSTAVGTGRFMIDTGANTLNYEIRWGGELGGGELAAHIHGPAAPGVDAGVKHPLPAGRVKTGVWNYDEADEQNILSGKMYVNIHSPEHTAGEIRGQIVNMVARLGAPEAGTTSTASGIGNFVIDTQNNMLNYHIAYAGLEGMEAAAHIHGYGVHTVDGPPEHTLPAGTVKTGIWFYPESAERDLLAGRTYVNVHSDIEPAGEIRGQVTAYVTTLDDDQAGTTSPAVGLGFFSLDTDANRLGFHIEYQGLTVAESASHIHGPADPGEPAGVLQPLPDGTPKLGVWDYDAAVEGDILNSRTYVNVHTDMFPGGEIRGQIWIGNRVSLAVTRDYWLLYR